LRQTLRRNRGIGSPRPPGGVNLASTVTDGAAGRAAPGIPAARATDKPLLSARGICKSYSGTPVVRNVDLEIFPGEILALMGENGAGKSTLMRILAGATAADAGEITLDGAPIAIRNVADAQRLGIGMIFQELNLVPSRSVAQNIYLGREPRRPGLLGRLGVIDRRTLRRDAEGALARVGARIPPATTLWDLSVSQQQLVEIAKAISFDAKLLLMDEPTSALSEEVSDNLLKLVCELRARGMAVVLTTHRMLEAFKVADRFVVIRDGVKVGEASAHDATQARIVEWMVGRPVDQHYPKIPATIGPTPVLSVHDLSGGIVQNASFSIRQGEILGFAGLVGAGRTELMRLIFGADQPSSGEIILDGKTVRIASPAQAIRLGISLVPEDRKRDALVLSHSVQNNMILAALAILSRGHVLRRDMIRKVTEDYVARLDIRLTSVYQAVSSLSGGNQQKCVLSKWLIPAPKILILDEPTRGIDVGAKATIYQMIGELVRSGVAVIFVSSDLPEVLGMSDRLVVMSEGRIMATLDRDEAKPDLVMQYASRAKASDAVEQEPAATEASRAPQGVE
jgi:ribose transport system ATP-binding protein